MEPLPPDHRCVYADEVDRLRAIVEQQAKVIEELRAEVAALKEQLATSKRRTFGPSSERTRLLGKDRPAGAGKKRRRTREETRVSVPKETVRRQVPAPQRVCPGCAGRHFERVGQTENTVYERIPERLVQRTYLDEILACTSCSRRVASEQPVKVVEGGDYGASIIADVVVSKIADSIPIYRQARRYTRAGLPMARSTLTDLFHIAAHALRPLWLRMLELVALAHLVQADETTMRVQAVKKCRIAWLWVFLTAQIIVYRFSASRSGETPRRVLGPANGEEKVIVVDAYTGYNAVVDLDGWERAGCKAHGRRKFFDAHPGAPVAAQQALEYFRAMYAVEREAVQMGIRGTHTHLDLRRQKALPIYRQLHRWLIREKPKHNPRSAIAQAIRYALKNRKAWMMCFRDARIPIDNNAAEAALRVVALLRKNALFVGDDASGENHAILLSLVATCQLHGVNPQAYLEDVLLRVQTHPASRIDELLPHHWKRIFATSPALPAAA